MTCCSTIQQTFVNESITSVPYAGDKPTVTVAYLIDGVWQEMVGVVIKLLAGSVVVDHGGPSTGVIKIVQ